MQTRIRRLSRAGEGTLSDMAFLRDDPGGTVDGGLFYKSKDKWQDLRSFLIGPTMTISSVAIDPTSIYFATEGRGVFRLIAYQNASFYIWLRGLSRRMRP